MGDHMPVHLGSMPCRCRLRGGNRICRLGYCHSQRPVCRRNTSSGHHHGSSCLFVWLRRAAFYVSNRAHHADVGGRFAVRWDRPKRFFRKAYAFTGPDCARWQAPIAEILDLILMNVRTPTNARAIFNRRLALAAWGTTNSRGRREVRRAATACIVEELLDYSERLVRTQLRSMPAGSSVRRTGWMTTA